ncbi:hypothetical protein AKJ16_DCAP02250 [Drosera capensis]
MIVEINRSSTTNHRSWLELCEKDAFADRVSPFVRKAERTMLALGNQLPNTNSFEDTIDSGRVVAAEI